MENENSIEDNTYINYGFQTVDDLSEILSRQSRRYSKPFEEEVEARVKWFLRLWDTRALLGITTPKA